MRRGRLIAIEGGDGSGKTTLAKNLSEELKSKNIEVITTREPGGTKEAERIRELIINPDNDLEAITQSLLHYSARFEHVTKLIKPALKAGKWVITDRFYASTFAYQGAAQKVSFEFLEQLHSLLLGNFKPDITIFLDIEVEEGLSRAKSRGKSDRYEMMSKDFHENIRKGFHELKKLDRNFFILDAKKNERDLLNDAMGIIDSYET